MQNLEELSNKIKKKTEEFGFLDCAIIPVGNLSDEKERIQNWLHNNMHGEMDYMARNFEKRLDPRLLFENAKTIIIVLQNYYTDKKQYDPSAPVVSKYAYGIDYHIVMKDKLYNLLQFIQNEGLSCKGRPFVDSAPVLERAWARKAGLGWVGKNSNLISLTHGSFFFIGELILDVELMYDKPVEMNDHCGSCTRCIDACPTKAIVGNKVVDARKCISYQTIELKGGLDESLKNRFLNRVFGCDICQDVCPWNLKALPHSESGFEPKENLLYLTRESWHNMQKSLYDQLFENTAITRTGYKGILRNLKFIE